MAERQIKAIITRGLQCSGKSTWTKEFVKENQTFKRVNRDDIRWMISNYTYNDENEKLVTEIERNTIRQLIKSGYNVVIDAMNLNAKFLGELTDLIRSTAHDEYCDVSIEVKEFPITLGEALERNKGRVSNITDQIIKQTWSKYEIELKQMIERAKPKVEFLVDVPDAIIVDIDGTLSNSSQRRIFDEDSVDGDKIISPVRDTIVAWDKNTGVKVIIVSGRQDSCRVKTEEWLKANKVPFAELHMRKAGDMRDDTIVKKEIYDEHIKGKHNVIAVFDDRPKVVRMWKSLGLFVFNVGDSIEF